MREKYGYFNTLFQVWINQKFKDDAVKLQCVSVADALLVVMSIYIPMIDRHLN